MTTYSSVLLWGTYLCLEWETLSIDKVYNTSEVHVRAYVTNNRVPGLGSGNASTYISGSASFSFTMNIKGIERSESVNCTLDDNCRERTIFEETFTVQHDSDGTKTVRMCATVNGIEICRSQGEGDRKTIEEKSCGGYAKLEDIPQASEFSSIGRDVTVNGSNTLDIVISPLDESCRHDLIITFGEHEHIAFNAKDAISFTVPVEWLDAIPTTTSGKGLITLKTFDESGNEIGSVQTYWNVYVPDDAIPEFDKLTIEQIQGRFSLSYGWIQHASKARLEIVGAVSNYGAEIVAYSIKGCGYSGAEKILDTDTINYSGLCAFKAYIIDSRGKESEIKSVSINVTPYSPPRFLSVLSQRCDTDKTVKNEGSYLLSTVSFEYDTFNGANVCKQSIYYKKTTDSDYIKLDTAFTNRTSSRSVKMFDISTAYDIQYRLTDNFGASIYNDILSVSHISMEFLRGGKGIAFGKEAEIEHAADFGYKVYARLGIMPIRILQSGNLANGVDIRNYSLFAVKITLCDYWLLGFRSLLSNTISASYSTGGEAPGLKVGYIRAWSAVLTISNDGDSYTAVTNYGDIQYNGYGYNSGDTSSITEIYALM